MGPEREGRGDRDLRELDDLELWLAEELRDWQLRIGADTLETLLKLLRIELANAEQKCDELFNSEARAYQYSRGQVGVYKHLVMQVERAIKARLDKIGENLESGRS